MTKRSNLSESKLALQIKVKLHFFMEDTCYFRSRNKAGGVFHLVWPNISPNKWLIQIKIKTGFFIVTSLMLRHIFCLKNQIFVFINFLNEVTVSHTSCMSCDMTSVRLKKRFKLEMSTNHCSKTSQPAKCFCLVF